MNKVISHCNTMKILNLIVHWLVMENQVRQIDLASQIPYNDNNDRRTQASVCKKKKLRHLSVLLISLQGQENNHCHYRYCIKHVWCSDANTILWEDRKIWSKNIISEYFKQHVSFYTNVIVLVYELSFAAAVCAHVTQAHYKLKRPWPKKQFVILILA